MAVNAGTEKDQECDYLIKAFDSDLSFEEELHENEIFHDYFNIFLSLPVFGKQITYKKKTRIFEIQTATLQKKSNFRHHEILTWIRNNRASLFLKAPICNEYKLCYILAGSPVFLKHDFMSYEDLVIFQRQQLSNVVGIQRFKQYLIGSVGENLIAFWLDTESYRWQTTESNRCFVIKKIQDKFLVPSAPSKLMPELKDAIKKHLNEVSDHSNRVNMPIKSTLFVYLQKHVLECIQKYWVPKYILHRLLRKKIVISRWGKGIKLQKANASHQEKNSNILSIINEFKKRGKKHRNNINDISNIVSNTKSSGHDEIISLRHNLCNSAIDVMADSDLQSFQNKSTHAEIGSSYSLKKKLIFPALPSLNMQNSIENISEIKGHVLNVDDFKMMDVRLPLIKRLETASMTFLSQLICAPPTQQNLVLPIFSSSYISKNKQVVVQNKGKQFDLLIAALSTDCLAGQPLLEYIKLIGDKVAESNYKFWVTFNETLHDACNNETIIRQKQYQTLINLFLSNNSKYEVSLSSSKKQELCNLLSRDAGITNLVEACDQITAKLLPIWEEFCKSDEESFLKYVSISDQIENIQDKVDANKHSSDLSSNFNRNKFNSRRIWKAMELALTMSKTLKNVQQPITVAKSSQSSSDEEIEDDELSMHGDFPVQNLHLVKQETKTNLRPKNYFTINNDIALTHKYVEWQTSSSEFETYNINQVMSTQEEQSKQILFAKPHKPRSFQEILSDPSQLDFFKHYLVKEKEETPLLFWIAVESMRTSSKNALARQGRALGIVKRFFGAATNQGKDLKCNAEVIKQIPLVDKVSPAMLVSAQACVAKSLEESWFGQYLQTFNSEDTEIGVRPVYNNSCARIQTVKEKTLIYWHMFVRNVTSFTRGISNKDTLQMFSNFLKLQHLMSLANSSVAGDSNIPLNKLTPSVIVINHKHIIIEKLVSDLYFWCEVQRYKDFADAVLECAKLGNYTKDDELIVVRKARAIIDCFINSQISPSLQINITHDQAENIITLAANGVIERGLFHEATLSIFIALIFFWKKFCSFRFSLPNLILPNESLQRNNRSAQIAFRQEALKLSRFKKITLPEDEECSKIMFSLQLGLRIALNREGKRAKHEHKPIRRESIWDPINQVQINT